MTNRLEHPGRATNDDAALVQAVLVGSADGLASLFQRHKDAVYQAAYRVTGSEQDAEDVLQDVFVGLQGALGRYEERGRFPAWIKRVATRTAIMRLRRKKVREWQPLEDHHTQDHHAGSSASSDHIVGRVVVARVLAAMPESLRTVFLLKEVDGYPHEEIAQLMDISVSAARVRLHRAWRFMNQRVKEQT